jgi:hypothetical protein
MTTEALDLSIANLRKRYLDGTLTPMALVDEIAARIAR